MPSMITFFWDHHPAAGVAILSLIDSEKGYWHNNRLLPLEFCVTQYLILLVMVVRMMMKEFNQKANLGHYEADARKSNLGLELCALSWQLVLPTLI